MTWDSVPGFAALEGLTTMAAFEPGGSPTLFNPLETGNEVPEASFMHEHTHQEITRATTFGLLLEVLWPLAVHGKKFVAEARWCHRKQWVVQEACATYAGICVVAHRSPDYFVKAVERLPTAARGEPPYREALHLVTAVLPIQPGTSLLRLQAQVSVALAIGHLSMNTDCLTRYANPETLTIDDFKRYLVTASPERRFELLLDRLSGKGEELLNVVLGRSAPTTESPVRSVLRHLVTVTKEFGTIITHEDVLREHKPFKDGWQRVFDGVELPTRTKSEGGIPAGRIIPTPNADYRVGNASEARYRQEFDLARRWGEGLWAVVAMDDNDTAKLDLLRYPLGVDGNPVSEEAAASAYFGQGGFTATGTMPVAVLRDIFADYNDLPTAVTFMHATRYFWNQLWNDRRRPSPLVEVTINRALTAELLKIALRLHRFERDAQYFVMKWDERTAMACIAAPGRHDEYILQYLPGDVGYSLFRSFAEVEGLQPLTDAESSIRHVSLLKLMSLPAFMPVERKTREKR